MNTQKKSHAFDYQSGVPVFKGQAPGIDGEKLTGQYKIQQQQQQILNNFNNNSNNPSSSYPGQSSNNLPKTENQHQQQIQQNSSQFNQQHHPVQPAWVEFDKKVLRFYAFEETPIAANNGLDETRRIRK